MSSIVAQEIEHFSKDSSRWWDENGPFKPLHRLNPVRLSYVKEQICSHYDLDHKSLKPFTKLSILDIGCGGGLVCEPMARMGAKITGIDADHGAIFTAKSHADEQGLEIEYLCGTAEDLGKKYDVVLALEVIEHVSDPAEFVKTVAGLVKPGGIVIFSTLNRTAKSYALGIMAAEYLLQWVPQGTHSWKKFIKPSELAGFARQAGLKPQDVCGLIYHPLKGEFQLSKTDLDVNYFMAAVR